MLLKINIDDSSKLESVHEENLVESYESKMRLLIEIVSKFYSMQFYPVDTTIALSSPLKVSIIKYLFLIYV